MGTFDVGQELHNKQPMRGRATPTRQLSKDTHRTAQMVGVGTRPDLRLSHSGTADVVRRAQAGGPLTDRDLVFLQRTLGNREVTSLLRTGIPSQSQPTVMVQRWGRIDPAKAAQLEAEMEAKKAAAAKAKQEKSEQKTEKRAQNRARSKRSQESKKHEKANKSKRIEARKVGVSERSKAMSTASAEAKERKAKDPAAKSPSVAILDAQFNAMLEKEDRVKEGLLKGGMDPDLAEQDAWDDTWGKADPALRALAPMRSTGAERLASGVGEYRAEYTSQQAAHDEAKEVAEHGTLLNASVEKVYDEQERQYQQALAAGAKTEVALKLARAAAWWKVDGSVMKRRPDPDSAMDRQAMFDARKRVRAQDLIALNKPGRVKLATTRAIFDGATPVPAAIGGVPQAAAGITRPMAERGVSRPGRTTHAKPLQLPGESAAVMAYVDDGLLELSALCNGATSLLRTTGLILNLAAEPKVKGNVMEASTEVSKQLQGGVKVLNQAIRSAADVLSVAIPAASEGFAWAVPGVDIVAAVTALVPLVLQLATDGTRLTDTNVHLMQARGRGMDPSKTDALVFAFNKFQSIYAKRVEQGSFNVAKQLVHVAAGITKLVASAAWGAGTYAGYALQGAAGAVSSLHTISHTVADQVLTWQAKQARKDFSLKLEGSAEELFSRDASYAVDGIIVRARNKDSVAVSFLTTYGITQKEIDAPGHKLHDSLIKKIHAQDEPKMVWEKVADASVKAYDTVVGIGTKGAEASDLWERRHGKELGQDGGGWEAFGHGVKRSTWITKMFIKNVAAPGKFKGNVRRTDIAQWEAHAGNVVLSWEDVASPPDWGRDKVEAFKAAVDSMSIADLRAASARKEHNEVWREFFGEVLRARIKEGATPALPTRTW